MADVNGNELLSFHAKSWSEWPGRLVKPPRRGSEIDFHFNIEVPGFRAWTPGQFVMLRWGQHLTGRPFAIFEWKQAGPNSSQLHLLIRNAGEGTAEFIKNAQAQDLVWVRGPLGQVPFAADLTEDLRPWIFLSEGARLAGVFAMIHLRRKLQLQQQLPTDFWWHTETRKEFMDAEIHSRAYVKPDAIGFSETQILIPENLDLTKYSKVIAVGSEDFQNSWAKLANQYSNLDGNLWLRRDAPMACGIGLCFSCTVETAQGPQRSCLEGPWFEGSLK